MPRYEDLEGKVAIVTGAASRIGAETARAFSGQGMKVVLLDRREPEVQALSEEIASSRPIAVDLQDAALLSDVVQEILESMGQIDVLVNNAAWNATSPFQRTTVAEFDQSVAVNLRAPYFLSQAVLPAMVGAGSGAIVNISSVNAMIAVGNPHYSATKAGLLSLTRTIAVEWGHAGIRCNAVLPGTIDTEAWNRRKAHNPNVLNGISEHYPLGRIGLASDVASAVTYLVSDAAEWVTGVGLPVDGGLLAGNLAVAMALTGDAADFSGVELEGGQ